MAHTEIILQRAAVGWGRPADWDGWCRVVQDRGIDGMELQLGLARLLAKGAIECFFRFRCAVFQSLRVGRANL